MTVRRAEDIVYTQDGLALSIFVVQPKTSSPKGVVICAHAMMADSRTFEKSGFATALAEHGYVAFLFNFRGRGGAGLPNWSYSDLVSLDVPAIEEAVAERFPNLPAFWLGHSLGGHVGLAAYAGGNLRSMTALVLISTNIWLPSLEPNILRRWKKHLYMFAGQIMVSIFGTVPVRQLRVGTVNEARQYLRDLMSWWYTDTWSDENGTSYFAQLQHCNCPILSIVGKDDVIEAHPESVHTFLEAFEPRQSTVWMADDHWTNGRAPVDHMRLVTSRHSQPGWSRLCHWLDGHLEENTEIS